MRIAKKGRSLIAIFTTKRPFDRLSGYYCSSAATCRRGIARTALGQCM